jgi:hypothetical protein
MTVSIEISPDKNVAAVAAQAGNGNEADRYYSEGRLYVSGVTLEALEAAAANAQPAEVEQMAAARASAVINRGALCKALLALQLISENSAIEAAGGKWPAEFDTMLTALSPSERVEAKIDWADPQPIRYGNALLETMALAHAGTPEAASALLDQLFGLT